MLKHIPKPVYEILPLAYAWAGWVSHRDLHAPWALVPESMFLGAAIVSVIGRIVYRHRLRQPFYATQRRGS
ncbi:MAG: hypothetical protein ACYDDA_11220 [Acidiferrobacteraceae bacterium]